MATISNSAAGVLMGWKSHSKVLALPSSPKQRLVSIHISSSLKYNNISHFNQFSSRLLSKPQSHAIPTTLRVTSNLQQEENYVAAERFTTMNSVVGSHRRNFVDMLSRILASLLSYGTIGLTFITMAALLYASNSALAASHGSMGGSSSSSRRSSSSSHRSSSSSYYFESETCTCVTSCTQCIDCDIKKQGYKQEKRYDNSCSCKCHRDCFFHQEIYLVLELIKAIIVIIQSWLIIILIVKLVKPAYANPIGTLLIFQVGVMDKQRVLQRKLNKIAENTDTSTLEGLDYVLKETVRALLQHDISSFKYSYLSEKSDSMKSLSKAFQETLDRFDEFVKDEELFVNVDGVKYQKNAGTVIAKRSIDNEYTLATICVLANGETEKKREYIDSFDLLQKLLRIPKNNIKSVRVMWTPQKEDEILTEEDLRRHPNLTPIVNGRIFLI